MNGLYLILGGILLKRGIQDRRPCPSDPERNYIFVGRKDHMIKSRGYRIELGEVEVVLNSHPLIRQAAAIAVPDELIGNRIIAFVSLSRGRDSVKKNLLIFAPLPCPDIW